MIITWTSCELQCRKSKQFFFLIFAIIYSKQFTNIENISICFGHSFTVKRLEFRTKQGNKFQLLPVAARVYGWVRLQYADQSQYHTLVYNDLQSEFILFIIFSDLVHIHQPHYDDKLTFLFLRAMLMAGVRLTQLAEARTARVHNLGQRLCCPEC